MNYKIVDEFLIDFEDGSRAKCYALAHEDASRTTVVSNWEFKYVQFHSPPEIFVSEGTPGSIVDRWVQERGGVGGIHHLAYETDDVRAKMNEWRDNFGVEFTTTDPIENTNGLTQCFTKPLPTTGMVYEFIKRGPDCKGFNVDNVRDLMESTNE